MHRTTLALFAAFTAACAGGSAAAPAASTPAPVAQPAAQSTPPAAAAPARQAPAPAEPKVEPARIAGSYGVSIAYGGQPLGLTLQLGQREDGTWAGSIYAEAAGTIPFNSVTVKGKQVQATLSSPDGSNVTMELTIDGDEVAGSWRSSNGDGSQLRGRRIE